MGEVDLTALERLIGAQSGAESRPSPTQGNYTPIGENAPQGQKMPLQSRHYNRLEAEREQARRNLEMYREYQENIKRGNELMIAINKGAASGTDETTLLLWAIECISKMTGNKHFFEQNKKAIQKRREH